MRKLIACLVALVATAAANAAPIIVPNSSGASEGNSNNGFPFNVNPFGGTNMRYQQVYEASQFAAAGGPVYITQIAFRPDASTGAAFASTLSSIRIDLSTTAATAAGISTTFASNVGADNLIVFNGALSLSSAFTGPAGGPKDFDIIITLTTPFLYDPSMGNLLMDVRNFGGGGSTQFDALGNAGVTNRIWALNGVGSPTGTYGFTGSGTYGLVTQFNVEPAAVPEPVSLFVFGTLLVGGTGVALRRRMTAKATA